MASSSSSSLARNLKTHEVFISFRGSNVRRGFLSHLYSALKSKQIDAFIDNELERGKDITENLFRIIERSALSIVIFSQNYPHSEWCLEELEKIHESMKQRNQTVVPVFYEVDPSDVQDLKGQYAIQKPEWSDALVEISNLSGFDSRNSIDDAKLIDDIVADVGKKLNEAYPAISNDDSLFGIDSSVNDVKSLLRLDSTNDVRMVGIWGMGGIGKTTLASKVFDEIKNNFDGHCFVANVREALLSTDGNRKLSDNIIQELLEDRNISIGSAFSVGDPIRRRLKQRKVLLVLDDVHTCVQLESLLESCGLHSRDSFCPGSRIIVTIRDSQVLRNLHFENNIYEAKQLKNDEALQLLCWRAFGKNQPQEGYTQISKEIVQYCHGVPLALVVLGSELKHKELRFWEATLREVTCISRQDIQKILRISFDGLNKNEKDIFLDMACFFKGCQRTFLEKQLEYFGFHASSGIDRLIDKSLLKDDNRCITMHDLLEQMGHVIVAEQKESKGQQSRLWKYDDVKDALTNKMGTENVEGIQLRSFIYEIDIVSEAFTRMRNLRYLCLESPKIKCPEGLKFFPNSIIYLRWDYYPLNYLPSNYSADKLVELHMSFSELEEINWTKPLRNLKTVSLWYCTKLVRISDLALAPNLEELHLTGCVNLVEVGSSLENLNKLTILCVENCGSLSHLPELPRSVTKLELEGSGLRRLPSTIRQLTHLKELFLGWCDRLERLPSSIASLSSLEQISLHHCINLLELPEDFGNLESLVVLDASYSGLKVLPKSIRNLKNLVELNLAGCKDLRFIPALPSNLEILDVCKCISLINPVSSSIVNQFVWKAHCQPTKVLMLQFCVFYKFFLILDKGFICNVSVYSVQVHRLRFTGSKLPEWMMYRTNGEILAYSVCLDLETPGPSTTFIFCVVMRSHVSFRRLDLEAILKFSETECCRSYFYEENMTGDFLESGARYNVYLWNCDFDCKFVKEVSFRTSSTDSRYHEIIKSGVHPIFRD